MIAAVIQERPRIIINGADAIRSIRLIGMKLAAEVEDDRVDLDGVDVASAVVQRDSDVIAAASAKNENASGRPA